MDHREVWTRERELLQPEVRRSRAALEALLHPDFREIGRSGRCWTREEMLDELPLSDHGPPARLEEVRTEPVGDGIVLLIYRAVGVAGSSQRSSLWVRVDGTWRVRFHQGTAIEPDEPGAG